MKKLLVYILINITLFSCSNNLEKGGNSSTVTLPTNEIWDMDMNYTTKGELVAKVKSRYVRRNEVSKEIYISYLDSGVVVDFFDKDKNVGKLTSNKGKIDEKTNILTVEGNVILQHPNGSKLYTDVLHYKKDEDLIYTDHKFRFISDNDTTIGSKFKSNSKFDYYEIVEFSGTTENFENLKHKFEE
ncbi:MAG: LPS export ABC transporter periplasmic protein LptC [Candidatus Cloacimonadota bacterium]|nr:MAG: LPS export ABC transporter periplasmic protein LptC [Candidatus Cloacimonadota bacterium]PIE79211.1 MAG: LPS export ABC transporter periplasmic protein LptC [Candidatus Delongbacteria bacterium]